MCSQLQPGRHLRAGPSAAPKDRRANLLPGLRMHAQLPAAQAGDGLGSAAGGELRQVSKYRRLRDDTEFCLFVPGSTYLTDMSNDDLGEVSAAISEDDLFVISLQRIWLYE